jgi:hypothetical protein
MNKWTKAWKVGSNQHKKTPKTSYGLFLKVWLILLALIVAFALWYQWELDHPVEIISPIPSTGYLRVKQVKAAETTIRHIKTYKGEYNVPTRDIIAMITEAFSEYGDRVVKQALDISYCESKWNEKAENWNTNGSVDRGIWQINSVHKYNKATLMAAAENIAIAKKMYARQGFRPWVCARKLGYTK